MMQVELMKHGMNDVLRSDDHCLRLGDGSNIQQSFQSMLRDLSAHHLSGLKRTKCVGCPRSVAMSFMSSVFHNCNCHADVGTHHIRQLLLAHVWSCVCLCNVTVTGTCTANQFTATSDMRLKCDFQEVDGAFDSAMRIKPQTHCWNEQKLKDANLSWVHHQEKHTGLMAQDVQRGFPEMVATDNDGCQSLDCGRLTSVLWGAVRERPPQKKQKEHACACRIFSPFGDSNLRAPVLQGNPMTSMP